MNAFVIGAPFVAIFVMTASFAALCGRMLARFLPAWPRVSSSTTLRALVLFAPWLLAAIVVLALASPDPFTACHCTLHGLHHPHLCISHPRFASPLVLPSVLVLVAWLVIIVPRVFRLVREVIASMRWARTLRQLPWQYEDGVLFRLYDCGKPSAFTVGIARPMIAFDKNLWARLSPEERRVVLHHEQAHVERRDGLTLLALRLCVAMWPSPLATRLLEAWKSAAEKACDRHAATRMSDATAVAAALISVEKLGSTHPSTNLPDMIPALGVIAGSELEDRVVALLDAQPKDLTSSRLGNDVLATLLVMLGAAAFTLVWPGDIFHHAAETLLGLLFH
jgi:beta-lactamase regulating signal transducer with metallopeptidase domain